MNRERRSLVWFIIGAFVLVAGTIALGGWLAGGGPTRAFAKPGQIVFISDRTGSPDVWITEEDGSNARRLMAEEGEERETAFAPKGDWIYYTADFGAQELQLCRTRPTGKMAGRMLSSGGAQSSLSVSTGALKVGYISNTQVFAIGLDGKNPERVLPSHADEELNLPQLAAMPGGLPGTRRYSSARLSARPGWIAAMSQGFDNQRLFVGLGDHYVTATLLGADEQPLVGEECGFAWAPDGARLAVATIGPPGTSSLLVYAPDPDQIPEDDPSAGVPIIPAERILINVADGSVGFRHPAWSPDGKEIAFSRFRVEKSGGRVDDGIWVAPAEGGTPRQIARGGATLPVYSPDGRFILYQLGADIVRCDREGGQVKNLTEGKGINRYPSWSPVLSKE